jgi:hypothetical protein
VVFKGVTTTVRRGDGSSRRRMSRSARDKWRRRLDEPSGDGGSSRRPYLDRRRDEPSGDGSRRAELRRRLVAEAKTVVANRLVTTTEQPWSSGQVAAVTRFEVRRDPDECPWPFVTVTKVAQSPRRAECRRRLVVLSKGVATTVRRGDGSNRHRDGSCRVIMLRVYPAQDATVMLR